MIEPKLKATHTNFACGVGHGISQGEPYQGKAGTHKSHQAGPTDPVSPFTPDEPEYNFLSCFLRMNFTTFQSEIINFFLTGYPV